MVLHRNRDLNGEKAEERRELDDGIERDRAGVLERIANGVANNACRVKVSALRAHVNFDDLLRVVPCATCVGHEERLIEAEERHRDEVTNEEERIKERQTQREEEDHHEDVDHALLRVNGANLDDFLRVLNAGFRLGEIDVLLDKDHRAVCTRDNRLRGCTSEPVDHSAADEQTEQNRGFNQ